MSWSARHGTPSPSGRFRILPGVLMAMILSAATTACNDVESDLSEFAGAWQSRGYGLIAEIDTDEVRLIESTPTACVPSDGPSAKRFLRRVRTDADAGTFALGSNGTLSTVAFDRLDEGGLDRLCPNGLTEKSSDPVLNFEVLWQTFDQHYAFFSERALDWDAAYAELRPQITEATSSRDLARMLDRLLEDLGDAHVALYVDGDDVVYVPSRLENRLQEECRRTGCDLYDEWDRRQDANDDIVATHYLDDDVDTGLRGNARWGRIGSEAGYLRIDSMSGLSRDGYSANDDIEALDEVLDEVMDDLGDLPAMIVDMRNNGGGHDRVAVAIAARFTEERQVFGSKHAYVDGHGTAPQELVVEPAEGERFQGPVAVLTSGQTASAAEIFTMAMRALPHATLIGEPTEGILSDELYRRMPNGWQFSLSNEIYLTHDGRLFEATGVPPDLPAPFLDKEALDGNEDSGIEAALRAWRRDPPPSRAAAS